MNTASTSREEIVRKEQEYLQDMLQRLQSWLTCLEARVTSLLLGGDLDAMKPGEREQAINRHLTCMVRLLQIRQQYAKAVTVVDKHISLAELVHHDVDDVENVDADDIDDEDH